MNRRRYLYVISGFLILFGLYLTSFYSYLLFHSMAELFGIVVACGIFMVAWNSRRFLENEYLLFIGIAYLFIAGVDILHTLAYKGLTVFHKGDTNLPTQLWIAARYMESVSLLIAPLFLGRKLRTHWSFLVYAIAFFFLLGAIFYWEIFPDCFVEDVGLTAFKRVSEYVISLILLASIVLLLQKRQHFDQAVLRLLIVSIALTIASELFFTFYVHAYGISNLIGHYFKIVSFYLIYKAIIETGLVKPYDLLFRDLKKSEESLRRAHDFLELRVQERTEELAKANEELRKEITERMLAEQALTESEQKYSTLVEESLTGVYIEQNGNIEFANDRFASIYGYPREKITGLEYWRLVHPEDRKMVEKNRKQRYKGTGAPSEYEARGLTRDGRTIWVARSNKLIQYKGKPAILGNAMDVTKRKEMETALQKSESELRFLSSQLLSAEETERKRIARELHDGIGASLGAIKFSIENVLNQVDRSNAENAVGSLEEVISLTQQAIEEVRRIIIDLRPSILDDLGILPTITWFCREFQAIYSGIEIEREIAIQENDVPDPLKTVIYRVLQEALNNIAKHSQSDLVRLSLRKSEEKIVMSVTDNGRGFDLESVISAENGQRGFGLSSMRERTELSGGAFSIESSIGAGTKIRASWASG
jgi:PAS domain S-box-containing protein